MSTFVPPEVLEAARADVVSFRALTPTSLPPYRTPVLVKLKAEAAPVIPPLPSGARMPMGDEARNAESKEQLARGTFYGYAVCLLMFDRDGFGRQYPTAFSRLSFTEPDGKLYVPALGFHIPLSAVEGWLVLG